MLLKPLSVVVSVKAAVLSEPRWTIAQMASYLAMDNAQVYRAARDATASRLLLEDPSASSAPYRPNRSAILELAIHGLKYMVVPARGRMTRGMPTAHAAPVMADHIVAGEDPVPVWPTPEGRVRGESFEPLHRCVPDAAVRDARFYDAMALIDAIRDGRARDRAIATRLLEEVLRGNRE